MNTEIRIASEIIPKKYTLHPNRPNPFNPSTTIRYDLPEAAHVKIKIYNMMGKEIASLFEGIMSAGSHEVMWNGRDGADQQVASGIYVIRCMIGTDVFTRKMLLMK